MNKVIIVCECVIMVYGMLIRKVINIKIQYSKVSSYKK